MNNLKGNKLMNGWLYLNCEYHTRNIERTFNRAINDACHHAQVSLGNGVSFRKDLEPLLKRGNFVTNRAVNSIDFLLNECIDVYKEGWACVERLTNKKISRPKIFLFTLSWKQLTKLALTRDPF